MDSTSLRVIEGKNGGKNDERPRILFELGESFFMGIFDDSYHRGKELLRHEEGSSSTEPEG
jgi:hypothetical protein